MWKSKVSGGGDFPAQKVIQIINKLCQIFAINCPIQMPFRGEGGGAGVEIAEV